MPHERAQPYTKLVRLLPVEKFIDHGQQERESKREREEQTKYGWTRTGRRGESELRTFTVFPLTTPFRPVISRKIKVNPLLVQLHLRDTVMAHFRTPPRNPRPRRRRCSRSRSREHTRESERNGYSVPLSIAIFNSTRDAALFVTACTLLLYNFLSIYSPY